MWRLAAVRVRAAVLERMPLSWLLMVPVTRRSRGRWRCGGCRRGCLGGGVEGGRAGDLELAARVGPGAGGEGGGAVKEEVAGGVGEGVGDV